MTHLYVNIEKKAFTPVGLPAPSNVFSDFKLDFNTQQLTCIIGPSGCGKTTLLNIIAGIDKDFTGSVRLNDQPQSTDHKVSYVFQTPRLLPWRTVLENIQLIIGKSPSSLLKTQQVLQQLGLLEQLNSYPAHLSIGMQRRVSLARAVISDSETLLMDEPFVSLDLANATKARQLLLQVLEQHPKHVIFVTHDMDEALTLADRIIFLSGAPCQVLADIPISTERLARNNNWLKTFKATLKKDNPNLKTIF